MGKQESKCAPSAIDKFVGMRVREERVLSQVSQEKLASIIGVTFQQLQKYENGTNRISAGRLFGIANALKLPLVTFFPRSQDDINSVPADPREHRAVLDLFNKMKKIAHGEEPQEEKPSGSGSAPAKAKGKAVSKELPAVKKPKASRGPYKRK